MPKVPTAFSLSVNQYLMKTQRVLKRVVYNVIKNANGTKYNPTVTII